MTDGSVIDRLDTYYDAVPRARSDTQEVGPFTLFVAQSGWPYYARPARREAGDITTEHVEQVLARQRELGVPQAIEWVDEMVPGLVETVGAAGIEVELCPLLVLEGDPIGTVGPTRILGGDEIEDLVASRAAISVGFTAGGTSIGDEGIEARDAGRDSTYAQVDDILVERIDSGEITVAAAYAAEAPELGAVGGGSYSPVLDVAEIAGVGVLPAFRRRGLGAHLTYLLSTDALSRGVTTVFCGAQSKDVARVYKGVGFVRVGTACIAAARPNYG